MIDRHTMMHLEAFAFERLLHHLQKRTDVQNIDLMGHGGFCRNCLADWLKEAADAHNIPMTRDDAREIVYGQPYDEWRKEHQKDATPEQLERMKESVARNNY